MDNWRQFVNPDRYIAAAVFENVMALIPGGVNQKSVRYFGACLKNAFCKICFIESIFHVLVHNLVFGLYRI